MNKLAFAAGLSTVLVTLGAAAQQPPPPAAEPAPAPAGGARTHDGFYFRIGPNFGALIGTAKLEAGGQTGGESDYSGFTYGGDLMFGGTPAPGLVIGGTLLWGSTKDPTVKAGSTEGTADGTLIMAATALFANYYLDPTEGLFFQGLLGFAVVDFVTAGGQSGSNDPTGFLLGAGAGYDFWIGDEWSVGPLARVIYAPTSSESGGATFKFNYLFPSIGVGFTLH
ncbi:MAG TPA: autotransporter domain-containing protein [Polyangiaceae bacterium]|nr:autotransporter domain-containing protein [Polyangiaceae bacterium]